MLTLSQYLLREETDAEYNEWLENVKKDPLHPEGMPPSAPKPMHDLPPDMLKMWDEHPQMIPPGLHNVMKQNPSLFSPAMQDLLNRHQ